VRFLLVDAVLRYWFRQQLRRPCTPFWLVSIASVFNYVSMRRQGNSSATTGILLLMCVFARAVPTSWILNGQHSDSVKRALEPAYKQLDVYLAENKFTVDNETGAINVQVGLLLCSLPCCCCRN
jgi:hypothetical protein